MRDEPGRTGEGQWPTDDELLMEIRDVVSAEQAPDLELVTRMTHAWKAIDADLATIALGRCPEPIDMPCKPSQPDERPRGGENRSATGRDTVSHAQAAVRIHRVRGGRLGAVTPPHR